MRTPTTFGIEYSFVPKSDWVTRDYCSQSDHVDVIVDRMRDGGFKSAHRDDTVLEVPSPVHRSLRSAKEFYDRLINYVHPRKYVAQRVDIEDDGSEVYHGTGGGHIHVGILRDGYSASKITKEQFLLVRNLLVLVANRPWLGWIFNEFLDDWNANAITSRGMLTRMLMKEEKQYKPEFKVENTYDNQTMQYVTKRVQVNQWSTAFRKMRNETGKNWCVNISSQDEGWTMEFRFFDAPRSWPQVQEHVDFVMALYEYARTAASQNRWLKLERRGREGIAEFHDRDKVEQDFKRTCRMIGVSWSRYSKYMENFDDRKEYGRLK